MYNEYQWLAALLALLISTYSFSALLLIIAMGLNRLLIKTINKEDFSFSINYWKLATFSFLFIVTLVVFVKVVMSPFYWYSI